MGVWGLPTSLGAETLLFYCRLGFTGVRGTPRNRANWAQPLDKLAHLRKTISATF